MRKAGRILGLMAVAGMLGAGAQAAESGVAPARRTLEQKAQLVHRLLGDSPAVKRISESGNEEARRYFATAAQHQSAADAALGAGDLARADAQYNEALWMIGKARQIVPDSMKRVIEYRFRYAQLLASIESLDQSYRAHLKRTSRESTEASLSRVARMVEQAKSYRTAEQLPEANRVLLQAQNELLAALGGAYKGMTIDYTPRFSDPGDEYEFELERNQSYSDLVPLALAELRPQQDAQNTTQRHVETSRGLRRQAQQLAAGKNFDAALRTIRAGTEELQRALAAAGLAVPQQLPDQ